VATKKPKRARFVPSAILRSAALINVIPAIALVDCGGETTSREVGSSDGGQPDAEQYSVSAVVSAVFDAGGGPDAQQFSVGASVAAIFDAGIDAAQFSVGASVASIFDAGSDAFEFTVAADATIGPPDANPSLDGSNDEDANDSGEG